MHTVDLEGFVKVPVGTIFSFLDHGVTRGLYKKAENVAGPDFYYIDLTGQVVDGAAKFLEWGIEQRWGMFDMQQDFIIYGRGDIEFLVRE